MSVLSERVYSEIQQIISSTLNLSNQTIIVKASKFVRFDWRSLIQQFESTGEGLKPPYVLLRPMPTETDTEYGMASIAFRIPIEIFFVESENNIAETTVTTGVNSVTQTVASTARMFAGQRLIFNTAGVERIISSVTDSTHVVLTTAVTSTTGEIVRSDLQSDVDVKLELIRNAFLAGKPFTNFQMLEDPVCDVSDLNPANEFYEQNNYYLFAGSVYIKPYVGEY